MYHVSVLKTEFVGCGLDLYGTSSVVGVVLLLLLLVLLLLLRPPTTPWPKPLEDLEWPWP